MTKEKKPTDASGSERSSSRGASKRPTSPSSSSSKKTSPARKSRARKREDTSTRKRRKTEEAVRKASARTSRRTLTQAKSSSSASVRRATAQGRNIPPQGAKTSSARRTGASARNKGASVRSTQGVTQQRKRPAQEAPERKRPPAKKRKSTAAEIARRKRNRRLLLIALLLLAFLVAILFTLHYVSNRIQDQSTVVLNDEQSSFAPIACTPDILDVSIGVDAPLDENAPITFTLNLHNTSSDNPCYVDVGRGHTDLDITSGNDPIVSLSTCESAGKEDKQLLIDRNMKTSFAVTWNRHRGNECSVNAATALPGFYKVVWKTRGEGALEAEATFEVKEPPKPEPTELPSDSEVNPQPAGESAP